jgi:hypothetical protein
MAQFFDDKEEVIDIELTEWGKYLYSIGKFKPVYYSFSDDEILYDASYGGATTEEQKEIVDRIMDNTPYLKTHTRLEEAKTYLDEYDSATEYNSNVFMDPLDSMTEIDTKIENKVQLLMAKNARYSQKTKELQHLVRNRIGTVRNSTDRYPAFDLTMLRSVISSSSNSFATDFGYLKIPQIDVELRNVISVVLSGSTFASKLGETQTNRNLSSYSNFVRETPLFEDGSKLVLESNFIALDLFQEGVEYKNKNFTVEVFEYAQESGSYSLKKLQMLRPFDNVDENGFLLPSSTVDRVVALQDQLLVGATGDLYNTQASDLVQTYFNVSLDREIPDELVCILANGAIRRGNNIRLDYDIECPDRNLTYNPNEVVVAEVAPGITTITPGCQDNAGGPGCR